MTRKKHWQRCDRCRMRLEACLCAEIPEVATATRVVVVITRREALAPSNTGRLATLALRHSTLLVRGDPERPVDLGAALMADRPALVLYPDEAAPELTADFVAALTRSDPGPVNLVVPDGSWRQTAKMRRRLPGLAAIQAVRLPPGPPSAYRVRTETKAGGLATIEAIARALGVLEGPAVQARLETLFQLMVERTLRARGQPVDRAAGLRPPVV